jgi:23S rRNA pseudouridine1911/1915/1917 synthase
MKRVEASADRAGERLDAAVARLAGVTRSAAARLIDAGGVRVGGRALARSFRLQGGETIAIELPDEPAPPGPEDIDVPVVYEDEWLVVVAKPAGLVVHPAPGHPGGTLVNALLARDPAVELPGERSRPGIVHRLDAGTSGLMIVAKDAAAFDELRRMMADREVARTYLALVEGAPPKTGEIDAPIGRSERNRKMMGVVAGGRDARTTYRRVAAFADTTLLEVRPLTGRTHQIRVHLATAGYPVVGDTVYGRNRKLAAALGLRRPFLHAAKLAFAHPVTGEALRLEEPIPDDLEAALAAARARTSR